MGVLCYVLSISATAIAAMPSSLPVNPRCSVVVALMDMFSVCVLQICAMLFCICGMYGASLGCCAMIVASILTI